VNELLKKLEELAGEARGDQTGTDAEVWMPLRASEAVRIVEKIRAQASQIKSLSRIMSEGSR
jgi:hypothetical protein